jgi:hypothetical protein
LDPADLRSGREVRFSQLADARLSFRTLLEPAAPTLTSRDIQQIVAALAPAAAPPIAASAPQIAGSAAAVTPPRAEVTLTDARKQELFLRYVNRLIDLLFRP